jgi:hypothetical protein
MLSNPLSQAVTSKCSPPRAMTSPGKYVGTSLSAHSASFYTIARRREQLRNLFSRNLRTGMPDPHEIARTA